MRVVQATRFGGPDVLVVTEAPDPVAGPGQVVVDVSVAGVLTVDAQIRRGQGSARFPVQPPYVPGYGVAGPVASVGDGVDPGWLGRRVVTETDGGGYAERALASVENLVPVPEELGLPEAAALLHDGTTALALFEAARVQPQEWVLVQPAGGGLGSLLVQLAHLAGARVLGAARGARKLELVRELGADAATDYSDDGWPDVVREATGGSGPTVVFDGVGGRVGMAAFNLTAPGGRFSAYGAAGGPPTMIDAEEAARRGVTVAGIQQLGAFAAGRTQRTERMLGEAAAGRIKPVIGHTWPLECAADAHSAIEARAVTGKILLLP
jgi:NADPH:quinone reductase